MTRASTCTVVALLSILAGSDALADKEKSKGKSSKAKELYEEGLRRYNVAEYAEAIRVWKEAYLVSKRPVLLFNLGQAYRLSGDCTQALSFYDSYRREQPNLDNQAELSEAETLCKAKLAEKPVEPAPPPIIVTPPPPPTQPSRPQTTSGMRTAGAIIGIVGVVSGGVAVYFASDAASTSDSLDNYRGEWGTTQKEQYADGTRSEKLAWGLGLTGIAAIGAGVTLFVLGGASTESSTGAVTVAPIRGGAQVGWSRSF
jgi:tetratricopeptide (TPR) repeat protein